MLLDGSGGDEALSGYHHLHYPAMLFALLRTGRLARFTREVRARRRVLGVSFARTARDVLKLVVPHRVRAPRMPAWIARPERVPERPRPGAALDRQQLFALERSPLPLYNRIGDRISMCLSIEMRNPFLDYRLVEAGLAMDVSDLLRDGMTKWALREAMRDLLPTEIVDRATKQGFSSDESLWMRSGPMADDMEAVFSSESFARRDYWHRDRVLALLREHRAGADHSAELWRAYAIERWLRLFVDEAISVPRAPRVAPRPVALDPAKVVRLSEHREQVATPEPAASR